MFFSSLRYYQQHQQFSAAEYCDRLKFEFEMLQNHYNLQKIDLEKAKAEKQDLIQLSKKVRITIQI